MNKRVLLFYSIFLILNIFSLTAFGADEKIEQKKSITLSFIGDCLLGSDLSYGKYNSFVEVFEKQNRDSTYFFKNVKPIFEKDDITIGNLENPLTKATIKAKKEFAFKGDPDYSNILKEGNRNPRDKDTFIFQHTFNFDEQNKVDTISKIIPCSISSVSNKNDFVPTPLTGKNADKLLERILTYSKGKNS